MKFEIIYFLVKISFFGTALGRFSYCKFLLERDKSMPEIQDLCRVLVDQLLKTKKEYRNL